MQWLRRSFIAGFFVTVPLFITVWALVWIFQIVDGLTGPLYEQMLGRHIPGLGLPRQNADKIKMDAPPPFCLCFSQPRGGRVEASAV